MAKQQAAAKPEVDNLRIWAQWSTDTPESALKKFKRPGGFAGTAIDPTYRIERLTQMFGPCGIGWGFEIVERWREDTTGGVCVYVRGFIWYLDPASGERAETSHQIGGTMADRVADESYKQAITDAAGKCCQLLGLAADIYNGQHDASKYQPAARGKPAQQQAKPPAEKPAKPRRPAPAAIAAMLDKVNAAEDRDALLGPWQWFTQHKAAMPEAERDTIDGLFRAKGELLKTQPEGEQ